MTTILDSIQRRLAEITEREQRSQANTALIGASDVPALVAALNALLELHRIEKRYQPGPDYMHSYDTPEDAAAAEAVELSQVTHFDVCAHCGSIEMGDEHDRDYRESLWPCSTVKAVASALGVSA
jgi:hypothetical protein